MKTQLVGLSPFVKIVALTGVGLIAWLLLSLIIWFILQRIGSTTSFWLIVEALSTAVTAAAILGGGYAAYRELSEVANSRHIEVANQLFEELNSRENIEARRWIFLHLPSDPREGMKTMTPEGQAAIKQVLNSLDHVAFLTQPEWIPEELVMPWMHPMIAKSWEKLEPYVKYERERRAEPYYYAYAGRLAERCAAWRKKNLKESKVTWMSDAL